MDDGGPVVRRPLAWAIAGLMAVVVLVTIIAFEPWTVLTERDDRQPLPNELAPEAEAAMRQAARTDREGSIEAPAPEAVERSRTPFEGRSGQSVESGDAVVLEVPDGPRWVRLEGLDLPNGPDLHVYLSPAAADAPSNEFGYRHADLGELVYNRGDSNYEIPPDLDLSAFRSVVIWCERYNVNFAVAAVRLA